MMYGISLNKDGTTKVVAQQLDHPTPLEADARLEGEAADRRHRGRPGDRVRREVPEDEPVG